ncbi:MAG: hypothetical protein WBB74_03360 [Gaiellaceae bacterium]
MTLVVPRCPLARLTAVLATAVACSTVAAAPAFGAAPVRACRPLPHRPVFALSAEALSDPSGTQLAVTLTPLRTGCRSPAVLAEVQVSAHSSGQVQRRWTFRHVAAPGGRAALSLNGVDRGQRLTVFVRLRGNQVSLERSAVVRLRPDLVVTPLSIPANVVAGIPFVVAVRIAEVNGDTRTAATVVVFEAGSAVGSGGPVEVRGGGHSTVRLRIAVTSGGTHSLRIAVADSTGRETNTGNNTATITTQADDFELEPGRVLVPAFSGYGMQFNQHEYAGISAQAGVNDANVGEMEQKVVALQPQFVRLFFDPSEFEQSDRMASFVRAAQLAQRTGATINITWDGGYERWASLGMTKFAAVLADLVRNKGVTGLKWVTVENEPNSTHVSMYAYAAMYAALDHALRQLGLRQQIRLMGGDLVGTTSPLGRTQADWFRFMATKMTALLDAYSIHVYWDYWDTAKLVRRLTEVRQIVDRLPAAGRRPVYVTEYGVRGLRLLNGGHYPEPGVYVDGTPFEQTSVNAFQHAWFDLLAPRLGYDGVSKWDGFFGKYDDGTQDYSMIGPPQQGWPLRPVYSLTRLFTQTIGAGWKVVGMNGAPAGKLVTAYDGPNGELSLIGLDTDGAMLNAVSRLQIPYSIDGLPPDLAFRIVYWNADGSDQITSGGVIRSDGLGRLTVSAPLQSVFALTSLGA